MESHEGQMLSGKLIIRGIEKPLQIPVDLKRSNNGGWSLSGAFEFNRHDFDVKYQNKGLFSTAKDKLIRDEIQVEVNLSAVSAE
jgi:polyisoprenoid-binding protein YceI